MPRGLNYKADLLDDLRNSPIFAAEYLSAAYADSREAFLVALRDTESALTTYGRDRQRDDDLTTAQARAAEAEEQAKRLYLGGKIDFLPFLDAQRTRDSADEALAASHARLATDQVAIFLALGGGWEAESLQK